MNRCLPSVLMRCPGMISMSKTTTGQRSMRFGPTGRRCGSLSPMLSRELPLSMPITWDNPFWVIMMGIEHQRIHLETSSVIIRRLPIEEVRPLAGWDICPMQRQGTGKSFAACGREERLFSAKPKSIPCMAGIMSLAAIILRSGILRPQSIWSQMENFWNLSMITAMRRNNTGRRKGGNGLNSARRSIHCSG